MTTHTSLSHTRINKSITLFLLLFFVFTHTVFAKEEGKASYYADKFEGRKTASGEIYSHELKTAAHRSLPFGTLVKVTNLNNNKSVIVKINDRGPFIKNRVIDLSKSAAEDIDGVGDGIIDVLVEIIEQQ
jgi:rare lipoprotein A